MSEHSPIQWTDATLNAIVGCDYVSDGCLHCYAATLHNRRYLAWKRGNWADAPAQYHQPFKRVQLLPERLLTPLSWRTPKRVFFNSMSDLWHDDVPDWFIMRSFAMMALTPQHTWQILTKRPDLQRAWLTSVDQMDIKVAGGEMLGGLPWRQRDRLQAKLARVWQWPLPNVWLGVSVEHQQAADERIPLLMQTPAAVRFLSCEPLLGPVDLTDVHYDNLVAIDALTGEHGWPTPHAETDRRIHWVIIGGESGKHARVMNPRWALSLVEQCQAAGVAVFMKQLGSELAYLYSLKDKHGGDMEAWPPDFDKLRIREFPDTDPVVVTEWDVRQENARA